MTEARITPNLIETRYDNEPSNISSRMHLARSLGGPLMIVALGGIGLLHWMSTASSELPFFAGANLVIGFVVMLPFTSVDGGVIWREVKKIVT